MKTINLNRSKSVKGISRRDLLKAAPALAFAPRLLAQSEPASIPVRKIHSFSLKVSDVGRSVAFYQEIFGTPVQARQGDTALLQVGNGPQYFSLIPAQSGETPHISHIGLSVEDFDLNATHAQLQALGLRTSSAPRPGQNPLDQAMRTWRVNRGGSQDLFFADIEGLTFQLSSASHCGGGGINGADCSQIEAFPSAGVMRLTGYSHFTNFLANRDRANDFYRKLFGLQFQAYQGPGSPVIGVGDGKQFLMFVGGAQETAPTSPGRIDHACFSVAEFDVDSILAKLEGFGITARQDPANTPPLSHWVSMRMPNRGGAPGGTPEVYFSDPDGLRIQLQDEAYCGGGGYLGDECPLVA